MQFLLIYEFQISGPYGRSTQKDELDLFLETCKWFEKHQESNKCLDVYSAIGTEIVSLWNVDSLNEMVLISHDCPLRRYVNFRIYPLVNLKDIKTQLKDVFEAQVYT